MALRRRRRPPRRASIGSATRCACAPTRRGRGAGTGSAATSGPRRRSFAVARKTSARGLRRAEAAPHELTRQPA